MTIWEWYGESSVFALMSDRWQWKQVQILEEAFNVNINADGNKKSISGPGAEIILGWKNAKDIGDWKTY